MKKTLLTFILTTCLSQVAYAGPTIVECNTDSYRVEIYNSIFYGIFGVYGWIVMDGVLYSNYKIIEPTDEVEGYPQEAYVFETKNRVSKTSDLPKWSLVIYDDSLAKLKVNEPKLREQLGLDGELELDCSFNHNF